MVDQRLPLMDTGYIEFNKSIFTDKSVPYASINNIGKYNNDTLIIEGDLGYFFHSAGISFLITKQKVEIRIDEYSCLYSQHYRSKSNLISVSNWPPKTNSSISVKFNSTLEFTNTFTGVIDTLKIKGMTSCIIRPTHFTYDDLKNEIKYNKFITQSENCPDTIKWLDLSYQDLDTLPNAITSFTNLERLYLSNNCIHPKQLHKLASLKNLMEINLESNSLSQIPEEIFNFTKLTSLSLSENYIEVIPSQLSNLSNLEEINLYGNKISELPKDMSNLKILKKLDISYNKISEIPKTFSQLSSLTNLYLSNNNLETFPDQILPLKNLKLLDLSKNGFTEIPHQIVGLSKLEELTISHYQIQNFTSLVQCLPTSNFNLYYNEE